MKKILVVNTKYKIYGGEDSNINDELKLLKKYFDTEYVEFYNSDRLTFNDTLGFVTNSNKLSNNKILSVIKKFKPDLAYVHNTWYKSNLGIFDTLEQQNIKTFMKIHNFRYDCSRHIFSSKHLKENKICPACSLSKDTVGLYNKYYEESYLKSIFLNSYSRKLFKILKQKPINILTITEFHKKFLVNLGVNQNKISIYFNPIDLNTNENYNSSSNYVVFAGRITGSKGISELVKAWRKAEFDSLTLKIIGTGDQYSNFIKKENYGNIQFLGEMDNSTTKEYIKKSRAVITATKLYEGQPRLLCEASSYGVPSIYPSFGGMDEFFPEDYTFSFEQYNYSELFEKIKMLKNSEKLDKESNKVLNHIREKLNEEKLIEKFQLIIEEK